MPGETDHLRRHLWTAIWRRRGPQWLAAAVPLALAIWLLPAARPAMAVAIAVWGIWAVADGYRWRHRINRQWTSWLNAAIPLLEDSSELLAADATTPIARLQQQRLQARLASALTDDDYRSIGRTRAGYIILPLIFSLLAAGAAAAWHGQKTAATAPQSTAQTAKPIIDGEVYLRVTPPAYTASPPF